MHPARPLRAATTPQGHRPCIFRKLLPAPNPPCTSAYKPEGIADDLKEARALLKRDFEHACALIPQQFEGREELIETRE